VIDTHIVFQVHFLVLRTGPDPLWEDIIEPATLAVHADLDVIPFEVTRELLAGELVASIGVEDLGRAIKQLFLPLGNQVCVHIELIDQLRYGQITLNCRQGYLGLKLRRMDMFLSSHCLIIIRHCVGCSELCEPHQRQRFTNINDAVRTAHQILRNLLIPYVTS
jgi:hypothetical protein